MFLQLKYDNLYCLLILKKYFSKIYIYIKIKIGEK